jgi:hypothetical protein
MRGSRRFKGTTRRLFRVICMVAHLKIFLWNVSDGRIMVISCLNVRNLVCVKDVMRQNMIVCTARRRITMI